MYYAFKRPKVENETKRIIVALFSSVKETRLKEKGETLIKRQSVFLFLSKEQLIVAENPTCGIISLLSAEFSVAAALEKQRHLHHFLFALLLQVFAAWTAEREKRQLKVLGSATSKCSQVLYETLLFLSQTCCYSGWWWRGVQGILLTLWWEGKECG